MIAAAVQAVRAFFTVPRRSPQQIALAEALEAVRLARAEYFRLKRAYDERRDVGDDRGAGETWRTMCRAKSALLYRESELKAAAKAAGV